MNSQATSNQSGFAMIAVAVVAVVLLGAVAGYFVIRDQTGESNPIEAIKKSTSQATANCNYNDKNICRFLDASTEKRSHTVTISGTDQSGHESISTIKTDVNDNSYVEVSSGGESFVTMSIGSTTYTKDEDGAWWKLEGSQDSMDKEKDLKFDIPSATASAEERVEFKNLGKEKCGSLTCFKYSFTEGKDNKSVQYIWFDDKDYLLRKVQVSSPDDGAINLEYEYGDVTITAPANAKEMPDMPTMMPDMSIDMPNLHIDM